MKRIALLLAGAVLGTGCIVDSSPCERTLTVDWLFVDAIGNANLTCTEAGVNNVDVWIDGVLVASAVPCTNYGQNFPGYDSASHEVVVEGFLNNTIINRDWYTLPSQCGGDVFHASPGEGTLKIQPALCEVGTTYLSYHLSDVTFGSPGTLISSVLPTDVSKPYTCSGGISFPVPYGNYDLLQIEETNLSGSTVYAAKCSPTAVDVPTWGVHTTNVSLSVVPPASACTW
jgi:hypothetical protein